MGKKKHDGPKIVSANPEPKTPDGNPWVFDNTGLDDTKEAHLWIVGKEKSNHKTRLDQDNGS